MQIEVHFQRNMFIRSILIYLMGLCNVYKQDFAKSRMPKLAKSDISRIRYAYGYASFALI